MINLKERTLHLNGQTEQIKEFVVWWVGVHGLYTDLDEALADCVKHDMDPVLLRPVSVAIGINAHYEVFMR